MTPKIAEFRAKYEVGPLVGRFPDSYWDSLSDSDLTKIELVEIHESELQKHMIQGPVWAWGCSIRGCGTVVSESTGHPTLIERCDLIAASDEYSDDDSDRADWWK